jgi:4,5-DOPA dioxygenase extradiol
MTVNDFTIHTAGLNKTKKQPVFFIGHGNPMNAIQNNSFTQSLENIGHSIIEKPNAILVISAHWLTQGTQITVSENPTILYDFYGFPKELYQVQYHAKGSPQIAKDVTEIVGSTIIHENNKWGLDHGAWSILKHIFPKANIPIIQLSIDASQPPRYHYELAKELIMLREKGILIIGSGNIVHNLNYVDFDTNAKPHEWALEFDQKVKTLLVKNEYDQLIDYSKIGKSAQLSIPTNEHYLPMLYTLGLSDKTDKLEFTFEEIQNASIAMRCFKLSTK